MCYRLSKFFLMLFIATFTFVSVNAATPTPVPAPAASEGGLSAYRLGRGDKIRILVYGESDLTVETKLTDAGTIQYPFLGEIRAADRSIGELAELITKGLSGKYFVDPKVSVSVVEYREFYINGEVMKPGAYPYVPGLTVQKAVAIAGGFTERASESEINLVQDRDTGKTPKQVSMSTGVEPGDVVTVEESFF